MNASEVRQFLWVRAHTLGAPSDSLRYPLFSHSDSPLPTGSSEFGFGCSFSLEFAGSSACFTVLEKENEEE
jgi:hypothetical protein